MCRVFADPPAVKTVTLKHNGKSTITLTPSISGPDWFPFQILTDPITIEPGATAEVAVTFYPGGTMEAKSANLLLKDVNGNTVSTVPLSAIVKTPIDATPSALNFGETFAGDPSAVENVTLKNNGTNSSTLTPSISGTNAGSFSFPTDPINIAPGDTTEVAVTFAPSSTGAYTGRLVLKDADGNTVLTEPLSGTVKALLEATPSSLSFGALCMTSSPRSADIIIKNIRTNSVTATPSISGTNASNFTVSSDPITIAPGDTAVVTVLFDSTDFLKDYTGSLELKNSDGNTVLTVPLRGTGRCPITG